MATPMIMVTRMITGMGMGMITGTGIPTAIITTITAVIFISAKARRAPRWPG